MTTEIAPPIVLCAACGCLCSGELVTVEWELDPIAHCELPVFRHASTGACAAAVERSAAFWIGEWPIEQAA